LSFLKEDFKFRENIGKINERPPPAGQIFTPVFLFEQTW
jgi:hypothetical protein